MTGIAFRAGELRPWFGQLEQWGRSFSYTSRAQSPMQITRAIQETPGLGTEGTTSI